MGCFERLGSLRQGFRRLGAALTRSRPSNRPLNIVRGVSLYLKQGHTNADNDVLGPSYRFQERIRSFFEHGSPTWEPVSLPLA